MQKKKDNIYNSVLDSARKEFFEKGFSGTNMRTIAKKAGVGLGNIYNYFSSKDEIFQEVLKPVMNILNGIMEAHNSDANLSIDIFASQEYLREQTKLFVNLIQKNRNDLNILFFKANGSSLEDFKEKSINKNTETGLEYLRLMKKKYPEINIDFSDFFVHTMGSWTIGIIAELVMHDLNREELERFVSEYLEYSTAGWKKLMKVD